MKMSKLCDVELRYETLVSIEHEPGWQLYGRMEGKLAGERLNGSLSLTNIAAKRPDNVNQPTLRGILTTTDGATIWVEFDGIATL